MSKARGSATAAGRSARRKGRWWRWAIIPLALGVTLAAAVVFLGSDTSANAELSEAQWRRVLRNMRGGVATHVVGTPASGSAPAAAARAGPTRSPAPPTSTTSDAGDGPDREQAIVTPAGSGERLPIPPLPPEARTLQTTEYRAARPKTIIELQQFRHQESMSVQDGAGRAGTATLVNLQPRINVWYLLQLDWNGEEPRHYHIANGAPRRQTLVLRPDHARGVTLADTRAAEACDLWSHDNPQRLDVAMARPTPYVLLCGERVTLRLRTTGHRTRIERVTDFLRDNVWGGERITVFVRETFFQDRYLSTAELGERAAHRVDAELAARMPRPARLSPEGEGRILESTDLGLSFERSQGAAPVIGAWYPLRDNPGVYASTMQPGLVAPEILAGHTDLVVRLDDVERNALAYLVAFDLDQFEVAFALGTDHPRLGWSDRVPEERRDASLPGPDGIGNAAPLVSTGIVPAALAPRAVATFTGGFKRTHGGFRYGDLALVNNGTHYGFVEEGVVFSKLQPGLSTIFVLDDGSLGMKTWSRDDDELLDRIRYARQNGVPILERGSDGGVPGALISRYGAGNWSGSQDGNFRTLRAGACLQETGQRRFFVYGYFSSATPSAMARVFQAYGCEYAMLLDMNALEHTYMAVYALRGPSLAVEHLVRGMEVLDKIEGDLLLPRFLGYADNRDFFYVLRRETALETTPEAGS